MTEWYVLCVGSETNMKPIEAILGRTEATRKLTSGQALTHSERRMVHLLLEGGTPDIGQRFLVVGKTPDEDRSITRVMGPGSEV